MRQTDEGQVWPAGKKADNDANAGEPRKGKSATEDALPPGDALASAAGPTEQPGPPAAETRSEPAPDTSGVDGYFARVAPDLQPPRLPTGNSPPDGTAQGPAPSLERGATPDRVEAVGTTRQSLPISEEDRAPAQEKADPGGVGLNPAWALFGRFSVRISVLVTGALVFCGLGQWAATERRDWAKVKPTKAPRK